MLEWTKRVVRLRKEQAILRRGDFFQGRPLHGAGTKDILWLRPDGREMSVEQWIDRNVRSLAVYESGEAAELTDEEDRPITGDCLLLLLNSDDRTVSFRLPPPAGGQKWKLVLDTGRPEQSEATRRYRGGPRYRLGPRSVAIFKHRAVGIGLPQVAES